MAGIDLHQILNLSHTIYVAKAGWLAQLAPEPNPEPAGATIGQNPAPQGATPRCG